MTAQEAREYLIIGRATDQKVLEAAIRAKWDCRFAEVDRDGNVWIEEPQVGHWLSDAHLIETVKCLNEAQA